MGGATAGAVPPKVYWADGAGSRAVFDSLRDLLAELRSIVRSDRAIALYRPAAATDPGYFVLSDSCQSGVDAAQGNERLLLNQLLDLTEPSSIAGLVATSTLRPFRLGLTSALVIPWVDPFGRGVVLIGLHDHRIAAQSLEQLGGAADQQWLTSCVSRG